MITLFFLENDGFGASCRIYGKVNSMDMARKAARQGIHLSQTRTCDWYNHETKESGFFY